MPQTQANNSPQQVGTSINICAQKMDKMTRVTEWVTTSTSTLQLKADAVWWWRVKLPTLSSAAICQQYSRGLSEAMLGHLSAGYKCGWVSLSYLFCIWTSTENASQCDSWFISWACIRHRDSRVATQLSLASWAQAVKLVCLVFLISGHKANI